MHTYGIPTGPSVMSRGVKRRSTELSTGPLVGTSPPGQYAAEPIPANTFGSSAPARVAKSVPNIAPFNPRETTSSIVRTSSGFLPSRHVPPIVEEETPVEQRALRGQRFFLPTSRTNERSDSISASDGPAALDEEGASTPGRFSSRFHTSSPPGLGNSQRQVSSLSAIPSMVDVPIGGQGPSAALSSPPRGISLPPVAPLPHTTPLRGGSYTGIVGMDSRGRGVTTIPGSNPKRAVIPSTAVRLGAATQQSNRPQRGTKQSDSARRTKDSHESSNHSRGSSPSMTSLLFQHPPLELHNFGATCYMNATLQCLLHSPQLLHILELERRRLLATDPQLHQAAASGTTALRNSLQRRIPAAISLLDLGLVKPPVPINSLLQSIKASAATVNSEFKGNQQNDAHEFLRTFLYVLHEEVNRGAGRSAPYKEVKDIEKESEEEAMTRWTQHLKSIDDSVIYDFFGGVLRSRCVCSSCGFVSMTFDPFLDLSLPVMTEPTGASASRRPPAPITDPVDVALKKNFYDDTVELLNGTNALQCEKCKKTCPAERRSRVLKWPRFLVLHLKRFNDAGKKTSAPVSFLQSFVLGGLHYRLYAVVCHTGSENFGHYISYVCARKSSLDEDVSSVNQLYQPSQCSSGGGSQKSSISQRMRGKNESWYCCNDNHITEVDLRKVLSATSEAYILLYEHIRS